MSLVPAAMPSSQLPASVRTLCALLLLAGGASCSDGSGCVSFQPLPVCPSESDKPQLTQVGGWESPAACQLICGLNPVCSAVHFSAAGRTCWLATSAQWWDRWQQTAGGGCTSLAKKPQLPRGGQLTTELAMWFNFRYSLLNLANASAPPAQLVNAARNSSGAHLNGSNFSYVSIPTPSAGFQALVGASNRFSYFIKAERDYKFNTYYLRGCNAANKGIVYVFEENGRVRVGNLQANAFRFDTANVTATSRAVVSLGVAFDASAFGVYHNGEMLPTGNSSTLMGVGVATDFRLGYRLGEDIKSLSGRIMCFGVWTRHLSLSEFQLLETEC